MSYYFTTQLNLPLEECKEKVTQALSEEGFGVLTEIDVKATLKKKLDEDFYDYLILGACNPKFAHQALLAEDKIGTMLPCNVILQKKSANSPIEVSAVDPIASMGGVNNDNLGQIAQQVQEKLKKVIEKLKS